jgi:hypothetical protein
MRRWLTGVVLLAGCASEAAPAKTERTSSPAERKQRMLFATERAIHQILRDARRDVTQIRKEFDERVEAVPLPSMLNVTDEALAVFDQKDRDTRRDAIEKVEDDIKARMVALLKHYENAFWTVATEAGRLEHGSQLGTRSGYQELDDKVEAAMLQLSREADVEVIDQLATLRTYDHVGLDREIREELEGKGVLSIYKSPPVNGLFAPNQEGQSVVLVFQRDGLAPEVPLSYVQAARRLVERAGIVVAETPWQFDPATPKKDGVVPLATEVDAKKYVVSAEARPAVDTHGPEFEKLYDHVLVSEYRTALRRDDTGEVLAIVGWQVRWIVDFRGTMRVLVERSDLLLKDDPVLPALLGRPAGQRTGS